MIWGDMRGLTLAFSKKWENHVAAITLHVQYHSWVKIHDAHKVMAAAKNFIAAEQLAA